MGGEDGLDNASYWRTESVDRDVEVAREEQASKRKSQRNTRAGLRKGKTDGLSALEMSGGFGARLSNETSSFTFMSHPDDAIPRILSARRSFGYKLRHDSPSSQRPWRETWREACSPSKKVIVITACFILLGCIVFGAILGAVLAHRSPLYIEVSPLAGSANSTESGRSDSTVPDDENSTTVITTQTSRMTTSTATEPVRVISLKSDEAREHNEQDEYVGDNTRPTEVNPLAIVETDERISASDVPNAVMRTSQIPECQFRCSDGSGCFPGHFRCDNAVQCNDASDEIGCTCAERLEPWKLCDGFTDCPDEEDELGCNGCLKNQFSCSNFLGKGCYNITERCNKKVDCKNGKDENYCVRLSPPPSFNPGFGFVEWNHEGTWHSVCVEKNIKDEQIVRPYAQFFCRSYAGDTDLGKYFEPDLSDKYPLIRALPSRSLKNRDSVMITHGEKGKAVLKRSKSNDCSQLAVECRNPKPVCPEELDELLDENLPRTARIVGGHPASIGEWPWIVAIYRNGTNICGGVILNEHWILTAGHCFNRYFNYFYQVQAGMVRRLSLSPHEQTRTITLIVQHPEYNPTNLRHDIALAYVEEPFSLNQWITPVCLAKPGQDVPVGTMCHVAGWGSVNETGYFEEMRHADFLQEVSIPIVAECKNSFNDADKELCAGQQGKDSCQGDSGSPLLCPKGSTMVMNGLVSHGKGCARATSPGVYTKISAFRKWIDKQVSTSPETLKASGIAKTPGTTECPGITCKMGGGTCVLHKYICDGYVDCFDALDETNCNAKSNTTSKANPTIAVTSVTKLSSGCPSGQRQCSGSKPLCLPEERWCDLSVDCPDRSDETECTCGHYLLRLDSKKFCDGFVDCADFSDESSCDLNCDAPKYFCPLSRTCQSNVTVCNRIPECPNGEDEHFCLGFAHPVSGSENDLEIQLDEFGFPVREKRGFVSINTKNLWQQLCAFDSPNQSLRDATCKHLGLGSPKAFDVSDSLKEQLIARQPTRGRLYSGSRKMKKVRDEIDPQKVGFLQKSRSVDDPTSEIALAGVKQRSGNSLNKTCGNLYMECGEPLRGFRPLYKGARRVPSNGRGVWPWHLMLYVDGKFSCDATLLARNLVFVSLRCVAGARQRSSYITLIAGAARDSKFAGPFEQIRAVTRYAWNEGAFLEMDHPFDLTLDVNPVLDRPRYKNLPSSQSICYITRMDDNDHILRSYKLSNSSCGKKQELCFTMEKSDIDVVCNSYNRRDNQQGLVVCTEDYWEWYAAGIYTFDSLCDSRYPVLTIKHLPKLDHVLEDVKKYGVPLNSTECKGHRCPEGTCVAMGQVCDGIHHCRDASDEPFECHLDKYCKVKFGVCACDANEFQCGSGKCLEENFLCDGTPNCLSGEDEDPATCQECVPWLKSNDPGKLCDGYRDCSDGADEIGCPCDGKFRCYNSTIPPLCVSNETVCDGFSDCVDGEDEETCVVLGSDPHPVKEDAFGRPLSEKSGYLLPRINGKWYKYCAEGWDRDQSFEVCKQLFGLDDLKSLNARFEYVTTPVGTNPVDECKGALRVSCEF